LTQKRFVHSTKIYSRKLLKLQADNGSLESGLNVIQQIFTEERISWERVAYYVDNYLFPQDIRDRRILDVGGGDGSLSLYIHIVRGSKVDVLDEYAGHGGASSNLEKLLHRLERLGILDIQVIQSDVRKVVIPSVSYDCIYTRNCVHHIFGRKISRDSDVTTTMALFYDWLVPGGSLVIGEVGWMLVWRLIPPLCRRLFPEMEYGRKSSYRRWRLCAEMAGFVFADVKWYVPYRLRWYRNLLGNELVNTFLTGAYVLRMRKP